MGFVIIDGAAANFLDLYWDDILVVIMSAGISIFIGIKMYRRYRKKQK